MRQDDALGFSRAKCFASYVRGPFDAALSEIGGDAFVPRSSELCGTLVVGQEGEWAFAVQIQSSFQCRKQRQKRLS